LRADASSPVAPSRCRGRRLMEQMLRIPASRIIKTHVNVIPQHRMGRRPIRCFYYANTPNAEATDKSVFLRK
jgi:hypothetical protein